MYCDGEGGGEGGEGRGERQVISLSLVLLLHNFCIHVYKCCAYLLLKSKRLQMNMCLFVEWILLVFCTGEDVSGYGGSIRGLLL